MTPPPDLTGRYTITVEEAAKVLGISRNKAYQAVNDGVLEHRRFGGRIVVLVAPLERLLGITPPPRPDGPGNVASLTTARWIPSVSMNVVTPQVQTEVR
jgi:excisionase family DNA binding protein